MTSYLARSAKRFALLIPGIVIAYISIRDIFPTLDKRVPVSLAIFLTYVLAAYVLIPALVRIVRLILPARHLPLYCITPDGFASDPLNVGLIGSREQVIAAMQAAGWHLADPHTVRYILRQIFATILNRPYATAPMSNLYLFGRKQDLGFEIPLKGGRGRRHHVRFWATTFEPSGDLDVKAIHWQRHQQRAAQSPALLWVGAASRDTGVALIRHNVQITHMIHPDTNRERELVCQQLRESGLAQLVANLRIANQPYTLVNRAWRGYLSTDGVMAVLSLTDHNPQVSSEPAL